MNIIGVRGRMTTAAFLFLCLVVARLAIGQQFKVVDIEGVLLLPNGHPYSGETVFVTPESAASHIKPGSTPKWTATGQNGEYKLGIEADGPIQLRFGTANSYTSLSHLNGRLTINCMMPSTNSQAKQNVINTIIDVCRWGKEWNSFIPEKRTAESDVVWIEDGQIIVPKRYSELFDTETSRNSSHIRVRGDGQLSIRQPPEEKGRLGTEVLFQRNAQGRLESQPMLTFEN